MIKNNKGYKILGLFITALFSAVIGIKNVDAVIDLNDCSFNIVSSIPENIGGYHYYTKYVTCGGYKLDFYCLDADETYNSSLKGNVEFYQLDNAEVSRIFSPEFNYAQKEALLRHWASLAGISTSEASADVKNKLTNEKLGGVPKGWQGVVDLMDGIQGTRPSIKDIAGSGITLGNTTASKDDSGAFTADISVSGLSDDLLSKVIWSTSTPGVTVTPIDGGKTLRLTGVASGCTLNVDLTASLDAPGTKQNDLHYVLVKPSSKISETYQGGIIDVSTLPEGVTWKKPGGKKNPGNGSDQFRITLKFCECKGTSTLCEGCGDIKASDAKVNRLSCADSDNFKTYCDKEVKKTETSHETNHNTVTEKTPGTRSVSENLSGNKYCNVFCLEDIEYTVPGLLYTKPGRYFVLKKGYITDENDGSDPVKIKGTRTCITSTIKKDLFVSDITNKQEALVNTWNSYIRAKTEADKIEKNEFDVTPVSYTKSVTVTEAQKDKNGKDVYKGGVLQTTTKTESVPSGCDAKLYTVTYEYEGLEFAVDGNGDYQKRGFTTMTGSNYWIEYGSGCPQTLKSTSKQEILNNDRNIERSLKGTFVGLLENLNKVLDEYRSCFEWTNNYCFNPKAEFSYDEAYNDDFKGELKQASKRVDAPGAAKVTYYSSITDENEYTGPEVEYDSGTRNYVWIEPNPSGPSFTPYQESKWNINALYVKKVVTGEVTFKEATKTAYTYNTAGTITTNCQDKTKCSKIGYNNGFVLPVALEHKSTTGFYHIKFSNIGVPGNDLSCNDNYDRINGDSNCSLANVESKNKDACKVNDYTCSYELEKCPECIVKCTCDPNDKDCEVKEYDDYVSCIHKIKDDCPDCDVTCIGCLWSKGSTAISYKQISLTNMFPDQEQNEIGGNWRDSNTKTNAKAVRDEIEANAEEIYATNSKDPKSNPHLNFYYSLTPETLSKVRAFNQEHGFNDDLQYCNSEGKHCKNVLLDEFEDPSKYHIEGIIRKPNYQD